MAAEIIEVCDAVVAAIQAADTPDTATVERVYLAPENFAEMAGRHAWVWPEKYGSQIVTRGEDQWAYTVRVRVAEKYADANEPTTAWMDARVEWVRTCVVGALDIGNKVLALPAGRTAWTVSTDVEIYRPADMEAGTFVAEVVFEFAEVKGS